MTPAERVQRAKSAIASLRELTGCMTQWRDAIEDLWSDLTDDNGDPLPGTPERALAKLLTAAAFASDISDRDQRIAQLGATDVRDLERALAELVVGRADADERGAA